MKRAALITILLLSTCGRIADKQPRQIQINRVKKPKKEIVMDKYQLRELISETLYEIGLHSEDAVNLLMGTAAQESRLGYYIKQIKGPALGVFQMEPATFDDIVKNYLTYKDSLFVRISTNSKIRYASSDQLQFNLKLAICFARIHYLRVPEPLPTTIEGYAAYWKKHYNTYLGAGTEEEFIQNYKKYVL